MFAPYYFASYYFAAWYWAEAGGTPVVGGARNLMLLGVGL